MNDIIMIAFSNGPRNYVIRVLKELGLLNTIFTEDRIFAVDDVLPYCKPEKEAFESIFKRLGRGIIPDECIMIEDSLKNIVQAKKLGMKTVFVKGSSEQDDNVNYQSDNPAVDVAIATIEQLRNAIPGLWSKPAVFNQSSFNLY